MSTGYCDKPWCTGKQLPLGFSLTGPKKGINMKKKETTWEDVIDFAKKKKITPEEFTQILIDNHEEVGIDKKQLRVLKKELSSGRY